MTQLLTNPEELFKPEILKILNFLILLFMNSVNFNNCCVNINPFIGLITNTGYPDDFNSFCND